MKKLMVIAIASLLFLGFSGQSMADIDIRVNVPPPPVFAFSGPPELVLIPGTYVYYDPDVDFDILFYAGYWYRPYRGYWYRSVSYEGPWVYAGRPPYVLVNLPPDYRIVTRGHRHIPYWELRRNWRTWQTNRYWDRYNWNRYWEGHHASAPSYRERGNWERTQREREHGLAPSYRGGGQPEHGGTINQRNEFRGGATHENRGGGVANQNRAGEEHENHQRH
ncbi:MAG: hypothetical protein ACXU99_08755 [Thermodesulfobacteriota bacterium]